MADENSQTEKEKTEPYYLAKEFSWTHFIKPLIECKRLIKIAKLGYEDIQELSYLNAEQIVFNKANAMTDLIHELNSLCADCEFIMDKTNFNLVDKQRERVEEVEKVIDGITRETKDFRTGQVQSIVNQDHFDLCLKELMDISAKLKIPINNMGIIYPKGEDFNFDDWAKKFEQGGS